MTQAILTVDLRHEHDVVQTRQRARHVAALLGFEVQDQTRVATAVSEVARNAVRYAGGGRAEFLVDATAAPMLLVRVSDGGRGIADLRAVLDGAPEASASRGIGLIGARRLSDRFEVDTGPSGTTVLIGRSLPRNAPAITGPRIVQIAAELARLAPGDALAELQQQHRELLAAMSALRDRQTEVERLNHELEETNRGVVALYAELDEKAEDLRRASDLKSKFLSNMSHELRTPLNSIILLARMLLQRMDGELNDEQDKQVAMIERSGQTLLELVNDLLDLAKIEAGKVDVRAETFRVADLFGTLRGVFRPLLVGRDGLELTLEEPAGDLALQTDEGKVGQILRNLISNAVKFTERGTIIVQAEADVAGDYVTFAVADTGPGISPADQSRLFQDYTQLDHTNRGGIKGTGLGLSLSRRLAELLGGTIAVTSALGVGSTFRVRIPRRYEPPRASESVGAATNAFAGSAEVRHG